VHVRWGVSKLVILDGFGKPLTCFDIPKQDWSNACTRIMIVIPIKQLFIDGRAKGS